MLKKYPQNQFLFLLIRNFFSYRRILLFSLLPLLLLGREIPISLAAEPICETNKPSSGNYAVKLCFEQPSETGEFSDDLMISISVTVEGEDPRVQRISFYLDDEQYLLTDYELPYSFLLPTRYFDNGEHKVTVKALMRDKELITGPSITLKFQNEQPLAPPSEWKAVSPTVEAGEPLVVAVVGDGASGRSEMYDVTELIASWEPDLFLYLGDVYEMGSQSEFYNWYEPSYGRFRDITNPVIGNHEYKDQKGVGFFSYWGNVPHYYSFNAGNWHLIGLNSNCSQNGGCQIDSPLYQWLQTDLSRTDATCTAAFFHHAVFSVGSHRGNQQLMDIWRLLVQNKLNLLLTGHEHNYQRWYPLNEEGEIDEAGTTHFVIGTGGHGVRPFQVDNEPRLAKGDDDWHVAYGALRLELWADHATYQFINTAGEVRDQGKVDCHPLNPPTITPPESYQLVIKAQDAFFGSLVTGDIELEYPDSQQQTFALEPDLILSELPAGTYYLTYKGSGLPISRLVHLPAEQEVQLKIVTYIDLLLALFVVIVLGFILGALFLLFYQKRQAR